MRFVGPHALVLLAALACVVPAGCRCARVEESNDRLRREVHDLNEEVDALRRRNQELNNELSRASAAPDSLPESVRRAMPHVTGISIGRFSGSEDKDGDGVPEFLVVHVKSADGRDRFVQLVGTLTATALLTEDASGPVCLGSLALDPVALRGSYVSGFMGTYYRLDVPLDGKLMSRVGILDRQCTVTVEFADALTGRSHSAIASIDLRPRP